MKTITLSFGQAIEYKPTHPERTARKFTHTKLLNYMSIDLLKQQLEFWQDIYFRTGEENAYKSIVMAREELDQALKRQTLPPQVPRASNDEIKWKSLK